MRWKFALAGLALLAASPVQAADITVMTSGGFTAALQSLAPIYEKETGNHLNLVYGPSMGLARRPFRPGWGAARKPIW